jgi:subtilisin family serine protease
MAATGAGVRVLVIDSGVEVEHETFAGRAIDTFALQEEQVWGTHRKRVSRTSSGDAFGHGTAVCSIIARHAPGAEIHSLQLLDGRNRTTQERVVSALDWALKQRYDVINCSFGIAEGQVKYKDSFKAIVDRAFCAGAILVAASNNHDFKRLEYPGAFPTVLACDFDGFEGLAFRRRVGHLVQFIANGRKLRLAWSNGRWRTDSGSSYAAPHLAALVARIRQLRPRWNAVEVMAGLYSLACEVEDSAEEGFEREVV